VERFPGTPIYMTPAAIAEFIRTAEGMRVQGKQGLGAEVPDSLFHPLPYPSGGLTVDGVPVRLLADLQGDVLHPTNSALWIPSLRAVLAGDIVFNGVFPYLAASTPASRAAWQGLAGQPGGAASRHRGGRAQIERGPAGHAGLTRLHASVPA